MLVNQVFTLLKMNYDNKLRMLRDKTIEPSTGHCKDVNL